MTIRPSSVRKREAALDAAQTVFLRDGFVAASLDEVAELSKVSKQTIYTHFGGKPELLVAMVTRMTSAAGDRVALDLAAPADVGAEPEDLRRHLEQWAAVLLDVVLVPELLALRRLVIGEHVRFPELARTFWETGPAPAMAAMREAFAELTELGRLQVDDPATAARTFNWLVTAHALNAVMLLGDRATPGRPERRGTTREAARVFLASYGAHG